MRFMHPSLERRSAGVDCRARHGQFGGHLPGIGVDINIGIKMLIGAVVMQIVGSLIIRKMVQIEY